MDENVTPNTNTNEVDELRQQINDLTRERDRYKIERDQANSIIQGFQTKGSENKELEFDKIFKKGDKK